MSQLVIASVSAYYCVNKVFFKKLHLKTDYSIQYFTRNYMKTRLALNWKFCASGKTQTPSTASFLQNNLGKPVPEG